jgi:alpha-L-fucosidase
MTAKVFSIVFALFCQCVLAQENYPSPIGAGNEPMAKGKFEPTWQSLQQYQTPEWFRNAKFGIWAHWGPQCQPEQGDWYARHMYNEGSDQYNWHVANYGHPSKVGFKDVVNDWKAEKWDPEKLVKLYKQAGAQYFFAMANHHDNLDMWESKYQEWNTTRVGPKKDIIAGWAQAAKNNNLPFGLSVHASRTWTWMESSQRADKIGAFAGIPYDGKLTKADGKGTWWEGLDPQAYYAQNHALSEGSLDINSIFRQWEFQNGASIPSQEYCNKFYNRVVDLINTFNPDLLYFDDTILPLYPISDAGLRIAAHYYNHSMKTHQGNLQAVLFGKVLKEEHKKCMVWDVERGAPEKIESSPWQTCTCIGDWHYKRSIYDKNSYKSAKDVIHMLVDIVSKNGNLLLNIPVRGDGSIDDKEVSVLEGIADWMNINKESIYDTRPWIVFGEGPSAGIKNPVNAQGFNEGKIKYHAADIRFNQKGEFLFATTLGVPEAKTVIRYLGKNKKNGTVKKVEVIGSKERISWQQSGDSLIIEKPNTIPNELAVVFKIQLE